MGRKRKEGREVFRVELRSREACDEARGREKCEKNGI